MKNIQKQFCGMRLCAVVFECVCMSFIYICIDR